MKIQNNSFLSIEQLQNKYFGQTRQTAAGEQENEISFQDILKRKAGQMIEPQTFEADTTLRFSKHAANRLADRKIELTDSQMERLNQGRRKASEKGIRETLVLVDQLAFIVNVPGNTVVTAMNRTDTNENVFTNIDGAVIM